jgi:hypothetical protein|tara:strand:+ start:1873 stop:2247 length:375 start_codon:yes stop_codon:yes gene_type:complete
MDGVVYMTFYVNIYKCGRAYGGPEEGGWFYSYGEYQWTVAKCENEDQAEHTAEQIREAIAKGNTAGVDIAINQMGFGPHDGADPNGEGDDRYLMTGGHWGDEDVRCMVETHKGQDYPEETPHYE